MDFLPFALVHPGCMDHGATIPTQADTPPLQADADANLLLLVGRQPVRECREQSGAPRPGVQAKRPRAAGEKRLPGPGLPGGRVVQRRGQQLPERAEVHTQDAVRLSRRAGEHAGGVGHLLVQDPRSDEGGPHHGAQVPPAQVFPVQPGDPGHQLQRRGHLHEGSLPEGSGESDLKGKCVSLQKLIHFLEFC